MNILSGIGTFMALVAIVLVPIWLILWIYEWWHGDRREGDPKLEDASTRTYALLLAGAVLLVVMMALREWLR